MKLSQGLVFNLIILTVLIISPIIILLVLIGENLFIEYLELSVACIFVSVSIIGLNILKLIRKQVRESIGKKTGEVLVIVLIVAFNILFSMVVSVLLLNEDSFSDPAVIINYSAVIWLIMLTIVWIIIHFVVFKRQPNEIQVLRNDILSTRDHSMKVQVVLSENPDILAIGNEGFLLKNGHLFASLGILVPFLCVEVGLISVISEFTTGKYPSKALYLSFFYVIAVPLFLYGGIVFSSSKIITKDKYLIILLIALIPTFFIEWLSFYLCSFESTYHLGLVVGIGFPAALVYWMSMAMIFQYNKRTFQYFSAIFCLTFLIPIGLILPLYSSGGMKDLTFWVTEGILLFAGVLILCFWMVQLLFRITKALCILIQEMSSFHSEDFSLFIYSFSFLLGYSLLAWMVFKRLDFKSDWTSGLLSGCFVVLALILLNSLFLQRLSLYQRDPSIPEEEINQILTTDSKDQSLIYSQKRKLKKQSQLLSLSLGLLLTLSISIPILVSTDSETSESSGITIIIGGFLSTLMFLTLIELKHYLKRFGQGVTSFLLSYCWLFCFIPLVVLIPVSLSSTTNDSDQRSVTSWSIGSVLLLFMIGVSILSITINLLLNRLEYEKIAKFCCLQVQEMLDEKGVKSSLVNLRGIYDNFFNSSAEAVEKVLLGKTVYSFRELDDKDPDLEHSKELLTVKELNKIKHGPLEIEQAKEKKGVTLAQCCKKLCKRKEKENSIFIKANFSPEELGDVKNDLENDELQEDLENQVSDQMAENWQEKFQRDIIKAEEELEIQTKSAKIKEDFGISPVERISLDEVPALKLNKKRKTVLQKSKELEIILNNLEARKMWLMAIFARFSNGMIGHDGEPWMNLSDLRNFIRLTGLEKVINNVTCDILYISITRRYNVGNSSITNVKITFDEFSNRLLPELRKLVRSKLKEVKTDEDLIKEKIFPHLVTNIPYLRLFIQEFQESQEDESDRGAQESKKEENHEEIVSDVKIVESENPERFNRASFRGLNTNFLKRLETMQIEEKVMCSKCLDKFSKCSSAFFKVIITCCGKLFDLGLTNLKANPQSSIPKVEKKPVLSIHEKRASPPWEEVCKLITLKFEESNKEARKNESSKTIFMTLNLANIIGIFGHIMEIYSFSSIAFYKEVGWTYGSSFTRTSEVVMADNEYWVETYWTCFASSMIFVALMIPALKLIKKGRLGLEADFTVAKFPSLNFFLSKFIGLFGKSMYMTIMCAMLSSFSCIYDGNSWHLMRFSSIECFSNEHMVYFVISIFTIILYYPTATLLFPSIAYQDKALDIKFDTSYLVLESQGKVLIAAFAVFFAKEKYVWLQLIVSIIVAFSLFFTCLRMKPCLVESYNLWKIGGFLVPVWACTCALINYYTMMNVLALVLLVSGLVVILIVLVLVYWKVFGFNLRRSKEKKNEANDVSVMDMDGVEKIQNVSSAVAPGNVDESDFYNLS
jgi:hypothetical protein